MGEKKVVDNTSVEFNDKGHVDRNAAPPQAKGASVEKTSYIAVLEGFAKCLESIDLFDAAMKVREHAASTRSIEALGPRFKAALASHLLEVKAMETEAPTGGKSVSTTAGNEIWNGRYEVELAVTRRLQAALAETKTQSRSAAVGLSKQFEKQVQQNLRGPAIADPVESTVGHGQLARTPQGFHVNQRYHAPPGRRTAGETLSDTAAAPAPAPLETSSKQQQHSSVPTPTSNPNPESPVTDMNSRESMTIASSKSTTAQSQPREQSQRGAGSSEVKGIRRGSPVPVRSAIHDLSVNSLAPGGNVASFGAFGARPPVPHPYFKLYQTPQPPERSEEYVPKVVLPPGEKDPFDPTDEYKDDDDPGYRIRDLWLKDLVEEMRARADRSPDVEKIQYYPCFTPGEPLPPPASREEPPPPPPAVSPQVSPEAFSCPSPQGDGGPLSASGTRALAGLGASGSRAEVFYSRTSSHVSGVASLLSGREDRGPGLEDLDRSFGGSSYQKDRASSPAFGEPSSSTGSPDSVTHANASPTPNTDKQGDDAHQESTTGLAIAQHLVQTQGNQGTVQDPKKDKAMLSRSIRVTDAPAAAHRTEQVASSGSPSVEGPRSPMFGQSDEVLLASTTATSGATQRQPSEHSTARNSAAHTDPLLSGKTRFPSGAVVAAFSRPAPPPFPSEVSNPKTDASCVSASPTSVSSGSLKVSDAQSLPDDASAVAVKAGSATSAEAGTLSKPPFLMSSSLLPKLGSFEKPNDQETQRVEHTTSSDEVVDGMTASHHAPDQEYMQEQGAMSVLADDELLACSSVPAVDDGTPSRRDSLGCSASFLNAQKQGGSPVSSVGIRDSSFDATGGAVSPVLINNKPSLSPKTEPVVPQILTDAEIWLQEYCSGKAGPHRKKKKEQKAIAKRTFLYPPSADKDFPMRLSGDEILDCFNLKVIFNRDSTGFEENKEFYAKPGTLIAGKYLADAQLGQAAFSKALRCWEPRENRYVCMKVIKNEKDYLDQSMDEIKLLRFINENGDVDALRCLKLHDFFYYKEHLMLVTELLGDNLYEFSRRWKLQHNRSYFTIGRVQKVAHQVLQALQFIHELHLIHCDLKPENILIKDAATCEIKVIDFGSSCFEDDQLSTYVQSRSYRAPEVLLGCPYDRKVDLWSLGCILAELWTGYVLFQNLNVQSLLARIVGIIGHLPYYIVAKAGTVQELFTMDGQLFQFLGDEVRDDRGRRIRVFLPKKSSLRQRMRTNDANFLDFLSKLLQLDPAKRPTAEEALQHPWFRPGLYTDGV